MNGDARTWVHLSTPSVLVGPVLGEMTGATLGAVAQSLPDLSFPSSVADGLFSDEMSR
jgi:hypothetical protein